MIVTIMQPAYLPWLGYFDRIALSDVFIVLDHVALDQNSRTKFANRNKIRTRQGWSWLTVPVKSKGKHGQLFINEIEILAESDWRKTHFKSIKHNYEKTLYYSQYINFFASLYNREFLHLEDVLNEVTGFLMASLGLKQTVLYSSQMEVFGHKAELILNLCRAVGATTYLSGPFGRSYLDSSSFGSANIKLEFHDYVHPEYPQAYPGFLPFMSVVDLLFNCGPGSLEVLRSRKERIA